MLSRITICLSVLLAFAFYATGPAIASPRGQSQQDGYTLSDVALAAAKRFSSEPAQRKYEDLTVVIKELCRAGDADSDANADCQPISRQQLIALLGSSHEANASLVVGGDRYELGYGHNYGSTYFSFEGERLKGYIFYGQPIYWSFPPEPAAKRAWYKIKRWSRKLVGALF